MNETKKKGSFMALVPFLIFILVLVGSGLIFSYLDYDRPFYQIPASVAVFVGIISAFVLYKGTIDEKVDSFIKGAADEDIAIMYMTVFLAGAFATVASDIGGVDSFVNFGLSALPPQFITGGMFILAAFMAMATGSSSGTTAALGTIAFTVGQKAGLNVPMILGAVLGGAFFGDNLSFISDTTIVAARGQGVELRDKFKFNVWVAVIPAVIAAVLFLVFGRPETVTAVEVGSYEFIKILPYLYVFFAAILGMNVFLVLGSGALLGGAIGLAMGDLTIITFAQSLFNGFADMTEIAILAIFIGGLSRMMEDQGGLEYLMRKVKVFITGQKSAELGIIAVVAIADMAVANNTAAMIVTTDVVKEIAEEYKIDPRRAASLIDIAACSAQGVIPYGNQVLLLGGLTGGLIAPLEILPYMWYIFLLIGFTIASVYVPYHKWFIKDSEWDFEKHESIVPKA